MNLIEYQLDKMYKTISFGNDCAKKIAIKNWIKTNLIKCKGFKNKNRPCKSDLEYTENIGYLSQADFIICLIEEGYTIKNAINYEINCVKK